MNKILKLIILAGLSISVANGGILDLRIWTKKSDGKTLIAKIINKTDTIVSVKTTGNKIHKLPLSILSDKDLKFVEEYESYLIKVKKKEEKRLKSALKGFESKITFLGGRKDPSMPEYHMAYVDCNIRLHREAIKHYIKEYVKTQNNISYVSIGNSEISTKYFWDMGDLNYATSYKMKYMRLEGSVWTGTWKYDKSKTAGLTRWVYNVKTGTFKEL